MTTSLGVLPAAQKGGHLLGTTGRSLATWESVAAVSALVAALCALPLPPVAHAPELAATLAVGAIAALGGMRWGIALLAVTDALLFASVLPCAMGDARPVEQVLATAACAAAVPGMLSIGRSAPHALALFGLRRRPRAVRLVRVGLYALALAVVALPLV